MLDQDLVTVCVAVAVYAAAVVLDVYVRTKPARYTIAFLREETPCKTCRSRDAVDGGVLCRSCALDVLLRGA